MAVTITKFTIKHFMRLREAALDPKPTGLTIIGGKNFQGKSTFLRAVAWLLGGARNEPSATWADGSVLPPEITGTLSNGYVVTIKGKNSQIVVTDPEGRKGGITMLREFIEPLALNLPKFLESDEREKARILLDTLGIAEELARLEAEEKAKYDQRTAIGRIADQKKKYAKELAEFPDVPKEPITLTSIVAERQAIMDANAENQRRRDALVNLRERHNQAIATASREKRDALQFLLAQQNQAYATARNANQRQRDALATLKDQHRQTCVTCEDLGKELVRLRAELDRVSAECDAKVEERGVLEDRIKNGTAIIESLDDSPPTAFDAQIAEATEALNSAPASGLEVEIADAELVCDNLIDQAADDIDTRIEEAESINAKIAQNKSKREAIAIAEQEAAKYDAMTAEVEAVRNARLALLEGANMPLPELTVESGELLYKGKKWDCMSGAERYIVGTAIIRGLNPQCGLVLLDELERLDLDTLDEFDAWMNAEGLQGIATRVSVGKECTIIINDGIAVKPQENE